MEYKLEKDVLTISIEGELNSVNSESVGEEIDKIIEDKTFKSLVLDFDKVSYISSAGLRIILKLKQRYDDFSVINASLEVYDVFQMTGFTSMMSIKKALRKIDLTGAEIIGDGFFSTVYRLNKDTIVKVFNRTSDAEQIERELRLAKEAFVLGVPTAISFDVVKVGDKMGVCFEMLDCMSLKTALLTEKSKYNEYLEKYAALLKKINTTECFNPMIPDIKEKSLKKVEAIKPYLEEKYYLKAKALMESIPERKTFVHGDCHFKNIMVQGDDLLLIDMDTLSVGHPIFELAAIYAPYCAFNEDDPGNSERFFGISDEEGRKLYNETLNLYFGKDDPVIKDKIKVVAYIHMVWWNRVNEPNNNVRLEGCRSRLYALLDKIDDLNIGI
jgi:uncharacterized protein (TIGR02172 family)